MESIILAAGKPKEELSPYIKNGVVEVRNKPILEIIIEQLEKCSSIEKTIIVSNSRIPFKLPPNVESVSVNSGDSIIDTIKTGLMRLKSLDENVLVLTSDIPFISSDAVEDFIQRCNGSDAAICYPIIMRSDVERDFKGTKRTYIKLKEGEFTGGNLFLIRPKSVLTIMPTIEDVYKKRKSPLKLVRMLGFFFLVRIILKRLTLEGVEQKCSKILGLNCKAIITPFAEIGVDVDKTTDLEFANERLVLNG